MQTPRDAFTVFFRQHHSAVVAYARRRGAADPEGIAAQVFAVAWDKHPVAIRRGLAWLYRAAYLEMRNERRAEVRADRALSPLAPEPGQVEDTVEGLWLRSLMTRLSAPDRELLMLLHWEDLDLRSAAAVVGCSSATAAVRAHRARRRLKALIESSESPPRAIDARPVTRPLGGER